jgi:hypothetical protein
MNHFVWHSAAAARMNGVNGTSTPDGVELSIGGHDGSNRSLASHGRTGSQAFAPELQRVSTEH